jgi:hypothetical protein
MNLCSNGCRSKDLPAIGQSAIFAPLKLRVTFISRLPLANLPVVLDSTTQPPSESDATRSFTMYPSNTLNRRPRGFSGHTSPSTANDTSIIPNFLRRLSSYTPTLEDSYSRMERMNGSSSGHSMGDGHRHSGVGTGMRRRVFKSLGVIMFVLAGFYFLLPWMPSFSAPFGMCLLS